MTHEGNQIVVFDGVYPPSEDSYLLLDALELRDDDTVLDVGCGSGVITVSSLKCARSVVSIDMSIAAARNTGENLRRSQLEYAGAIVQADLLTALSPEAKFSAIVFNPPYLPIEEQSTDMDQALVGGERGNEVILRFLPQAVKHLEPAGVVCFVMSSLSNPEQVEKMMESLGLSVSIAATRHQFFERLLVIRGFLRHKEIVL